MIQPLAQQVTRSSPSPSSGCFAREGQRNRTARPLTQFLFQSLLQHSNWIQLPTDWRPPTDTVWISGKWRLQRDLQVRLIAIGIVRQNDTDIYEIVPLEETLTEVQQLLRWCISVECDIVLRRPETHTLVAYSGTCRCILRKYIYTLKQYEVKKHHNP